MVDYLVKSDFLDDLWSISTMWRKKDSTSGNGVESPNRKPLLPRHNFESQKTAGKHLFLHQPTITLRLECVEIERGWGMWMRHQRFSRLETFNERMASQFFCGMVEKPLECNSKCYLECGMVEMFLEHLHLYAPRV